MRRPRRPRVPRPKKPRKPRKPKPVSTYPRIKEEWKSNFHSLFTSWTGIGVGVCPAPVTHSYDYRQYVKDFVILGKSPDNWKELLLTGGQAGSQMSGVRYFAFSREISYDYFRDAQNYPSDNRCQRGFAVGSLGILAFPPLITSISADADFRARQKFLGKSLDAKKAWRGANVLAEFRETIHMLRHPLQGLSTNLTNFARAVKRLRGLRNNAYAKAIGNTWLEYSFGWSPFFGDIRDVMGALNKFRDGTYADSQRISATGYVETATAPVPATFGIPDVANLALAQTFTKFKAVVRYRAALRARPEVVPTIADNFGFTPTDILPAVWEAIPWSFFIDYFLNVQEQLDSCQLSIAEYAWIMRGIVNTNSRVQSAIYPNMQAAAASHYAVRASGGSANSSAIYKQRDPQFAVPLPPWRFRVPGIGSLKWVNIGALATQFARSRP